MPRADGGELLGQGAVVKVSLGVLHGGEGGRTFSSLFFGSRLVATFLLFFLLLVEHCAPGDALGKGAKQTSQEQ